MKIVMEDVCCGYDGKKVVDSFTATVASGEILCLLGPNGVGKTTLFKSLLGLTPLMSGRVIIDGKSIDQLSIREYAKIVGYVPQNHIPPFDYTVFDVVAMGRTAHLGMFGHPGKKDKKIARECLEKLGIAFLEGRIYTQLSGGERQMVLIARALAQEPAFLLMDEPSNNLDFGNQAKVLQTVRILAEQGLGIIMTTHDPDHVFQCDAKVSLMKRNFEYLFGSAEEIMTEVNLKDTYGIEIAVLESEYQGEKLHLCQPIVKKTLK